MQKSAFLLIAVLGLVSLTSALPKQENDILIGVKPSSAAAGKAKLLYLVERTLSWNEAYFYCKQAYNGDLVAIETAQDDEYIKDFMILHSLTFAWTSGIYEGSWRWGEGAVFTYTNWAPGFPGSNSNAVYLYSSGVLTYNWRTTFKTSSYASICQA